LIIAFGLFHGVILLPIILSLVGPEEKRTKAPDTANQRQEPCEDRDHDSSIMGDESQEKMIPSNDQYPRL